MPTLHTMKQQQLSFLLFLLVISTSSIFASLDDLFDDLENRRTCEFLVRETANEGDCATFCAQEDMTAECFECARRITARQRLFDKLECSNALDRRPVATFCGYLKEVANGMTNMCEALGCFGKQQHQDLCESFVNYVIRVSEIGASMKCGDV